MNVFEKKNSNYLFLPSTLAKSEILITRDPRRKALLVLLQFAVHKKQTSRWNTTSTSGKHVEAMPNIFVRATNCHPIVGQTMVAIIEIQVLYMLSSKLEGNISCLCIVRPVNS